MSINKNLNISYTKESLFCCCCFSLHFLSTNHTIFHDGTLNLPCRSYYNFKKFKLKWSVMIMFICVHFMASIRFLYHIYTHIHKHISKILSTWWVPNEIIMCSNQKKRYPHGLTALFKIDIDSIHNLSLV